MGLNEEIKKQREGFAKQMENCQASMKFHKTQMLKLEAQMEQLKGAIYALDKVLTTAEPPPVELNEEVKDGETKENT